LKITKNKNFKSLFAKKSCSSTSAVQIDLWLWVCTNQ